MERILVIKLGALGDFIAALGPMAAIRQHHHDAHITLLTTQPYAQLGHDSKYFNDVMVDARPRWHDLKGWLQLRRAFSAGLFNRVYDLQNNDRTALYFRLFSPKPEWVGIARGASHRNTSSERTAGRAFDGHVQTLSLAGISDIKPDTLTWMKTDISRFALKQPYIIFVSGSSPHRPAKRWPITCFRNLAMRCLKEGYKVVIIGQESERAINAAISSGLEVHDLTGQTALYDIAELSRHAAGAVGNDTGPSHMIAVTDCPIVMLYCTSESSVLKHRPLGTSAFALEAENLEDINAEKVWEVLRPVLREDKIRF